MNQTGNAQKSGCGSIVVHQHPVSAELSSQPALVSSATPIPQFCMSEAIGRGAAVGLLGTSSSPAALNQSADDNTQMSAKWKNQNLNTLCEILSQFHAL